MAKIDASRISSDALADLRAGRSVRLVKSGRTIATLRAQRARTQADAAHQSLLADDGAQNFVLAHNACNLDKGDMLGAPAHLAHWVKRNRELGADLAARLSPAGFLDDQAAALQVARWAYRQAEATSAQLWVSLKYTVNADRRCVEILGTE